MTTSSITLTLSLDEAKAVLQVLGQLPTSSGAFPLMVKISEQIDTQTKSAGGEN